MASSSFFLGLTRVSRPTEYFSGDQHPVVTVIWQSPASARQRWTARHPPTAILPEFKRQWYQDIEAQNTERHLVQKIFFQPDVNLDLAIAQIVSGTNSIRGFMPAASRPYRGANTMRPACLSADRLSSTRSHNSFALRHIRLRQTLAPIHGLTLPTPAGGSYRQIMVDIDPASFSQRASRARHRQCRQCQEQHPALGHGEDRRQTVQRPDECDASHDR